MCWFRCYWNIYFLYQCFPNWKQYFLFLLHTSILAIIPLEWGPHGVPGNFDEINRVVSVTSQRVLSLAPRHKSVVHANFFTLKKIEYYLTQLPKCMGNGALTCHIITKSDYIKHISKVSSGSFIAWSRYPRVLGIYLLCYTNACCCFHL